MTADPLTVDVDDLFRLPAPERMALVDWANAVTEGKCRYIEAVTLGEGVVRVRYYVTGKDGPVWDRDDFVMAEGEFAAPVPPPVWKPLR